MPCPDPSGVSCTESAGEPRVRMHLRESLGFTNRAAHSRAVAELERLGFIEVQRRKGHAPLVRLVPRQEAQGSDAGG
jgi:hypothetical protein